MAAEPKGGSGSSRVWGAEQNGTRLPSVKVEKKKQKKKSRGK
jgi:hypothetical protein